jgi:hypothetical protein
VKTRKLKAGELKAKKLKGESKEAQRGKKKG